MQTPFTAADLVQALVHYRLRWIVPAILIFVFALGYALFCRKTWEATQALTVRDEAIGGHSRPGRFESLDSMKTAQETVLALARSRAVVSAALAQIGPPRGHRDSASWPTPRDVEKTQRLIKVSAPNGAEFGHTEVFLLHVRDTDRQRAIQLASALCDRLDLRLRELRDRQAKSLVDELTQTVRLARTDLQEATGRLTQVEQDVGIDLAELRSLNQAVSGEGILRATEIATKTELRQARAVEGTNEKLLEMLRAAQQDPSQLVATPNQLLESQPALRRMKDGLIDAQLRTAALLGEMSPEHPRVQAALAAESRIKLQLHAELETAIRGIEAEVQVCRTRVESLDQQLGQVNRRMTKVASLRAEYENLVAEVAHRGEILKRAQQELSDAQAIQSGARTASQLTRLDSPATGTDPLGPPRSVILLAGLLGGLAAGLGVVFLTVPLGQPAAQIPPDAVRPLWKDQDARIASLNLSLRKILAM